MTKIDEARDILNKIGMPKAQQSDLCCCVLLTLAGVIIDQSWENAESTWLGIHEIIGLIRDNYKLAYAENTRETVRKSAIHNFRNAAIIEDNGTATNSPLYRYRITDAMLVLIKSYNTDRWEHELDEFLSHHERLIEQYASKKTMVKMPVNIDGNEFAFSPGKHNQLQKAIIEEFAPRFAPGCVCLYVGDTTDRNLFKNDAELKALGFEISLHDKMPDVVLYRDDMKWIYFIEAVTSVGAMTAKRIAELNQMTKEVKAGNVYITAFIDFKTYRRFANSLAWETEVWIAESPDHMIHLNGDKFLGPR